MGLARVLSRASGCLEATPVSVEVHLAGGLPRVHIVGMPRKAVTESIDRVKAAIVNSGFQFPVSAVTVSLAPAELPKDGGGFDLPIALGLLAASGQIQTDRLAGTEFCGELSLGGSLRAVAGILPAAIRARGASHTLVVPRSNARELSLLGDGSFHCAESLLQVTAWLNGQDTLTEPPERQPGDMAPVPDIADVMGQAPALRALEIAAAGAHNLLLIGPPGTGKTMLATRLPGLLPVMTRKEALESAAIASISRGGLDASGFGARPFRAPHHTASAASLVGGGARPEPGEVSLAHNGVLFLDELPEFNRHAVEVLREPLESGRIMIARAMHRARFPARFQLVCAMNPCPCGLAGDPSGRCRCSAAQILRYRNRVSGPFMDRMDLCIEVPRPPPELLRQSAPKTSGENSSGVRHRVHQARQRQLARAACANAQLSSSETTRTCALPPGLEDTLVSAASQRHLSPRACHRILRLTRTIADLEEKNTPESGHLLEAIALHGAGKSSEQDA